MKFIYVDESGSRDQGDAFVMCGLTVDACKLRKKLKILIVCLRLYSPIIPETERISRRAGSSMARMAGARSTRPSERRSSRAFVSWPSRMVARSSILNISFAPLLTTHAATMRAMGWSIKQEGHGVPRRPCAAPLPARWNA